MLIRRNRLGRLILHLACGLRAMYINNLDVTRPPKAFQHESRLEYTL